jgi:hypothetical protein
MPVELHERLSEFSYGYGVTREVELQLQKEGLAATPFLPSLLHEGELGFDVGFARAGTPLLLQFKLGQALRRFVPAPRPDLQQPFWRYRIDTAEPDGQFELLLKAERDGADVFYVAPKFHDWEIYLEAFESSEILKRSLIVRPSDIRRALDDHGVVDGLHKIAYDRHKAFLCSDPLRLQATSPSDLAKKVRANIERRDTAIADILEQVFQGFDDRALVRRSPAITESDRDDRKVYAIPSDQGQQPELRRRRFGRLLERGRSREEAIALAVGAEAWSLGAQLIFVTVKQGVPQVQA